LGDALSGTAGRVEAGGLGLRPGIQVRPGAELNFRRWSCCRSEWSRSGANRG
jgi:hypothetical protein